MHTTSQDDAIPRSDDLILVAGGTGKTGSRVATRIRALDISLRIGSRRSTPPLDWNDPDTWSGSLDGVSAAYIAYTPDLGFPGAADTLGAFAATARRCGVEHLVLLSGRGEEDAAVSENTVRAAFPNVTVLRASWFAQNFSEHFLLGPVLDGVIALPAGDVAEPFIDAEDIADVAVAALTDAGHRGKLYELTGPELLSFADVAQELSRTTGRDVTYLSVSPEEYAAGAIDAGVPVEEVAPLTDLFTRVLDGRNSSLTADVERVLGRPARRFSAYASEAAATGVWDVPALGAS
jgi:uncharacterized protein YbjT (DUF2867 family)